MADKKASRTVALYIDGKAVEGSVKDIRARVRELTGDMNKLTIGTEEYEEKVAEIRKLNGILDEHRRKLKGVGDEAKDTGGMFGKMTEMIKGHFEDMGTSSLGSFEGMLGGMKGSWMKFAGWIGVGVAAVKGAIDAGKWWYNYSVEVEEAQRLTKEFLGITGSELRHVQSEISAVSKAMGKDYKEVLGTVDMLTKQFGISSDEALTAIKDGIQAGGDLNGTLLQQLQQFGPAARDAGQSVEELVAMIVQTRSGIFNEEGMAMVQTAENKLRQMSSKTAASLDAVKISSKQMEADLVSGQMTMFEAVQMVAQKLQELPPNSAEVGQVMKNVFGQAAANEGMEMVAAIADMNTNMEDLMAVTGEYGEIQREQIEAEAELTEKFEEYFGIGDTGFQELKGKAKLYLTQGLIKIIDGTKNVINWFIDWYNKSMLVRGAIQVISYAFKGAFNVVKTFVNVAIDGFKQLGRELKGMANVIKGIFTLNADTIMHGLDQMFNVTPLLKELGGDISSFFKDAGRDAVNAWNNAVDGNLHYLGSGDGPSSLGEVTVIGHRNTDGGGDDGGGGGGGDDGGGGGGGGGGGSRSGSRGGNGRSGNRGSGGNNAEAEERKRQKEERERIQKELNDIDIKYAEERRKIQERYIKGEIGSKEELSRELEKLERQELDAKLAIAGLEEKQRSALKDKLVAMQKELYEQLQDVVADNADEEKESWDKKSEDLQKQEDRQREIIEEAHKQGLIDEEAYQVQLTKLQKKYQKKRAENKREQERAELSATLVSRERLGAEMGESEQKTQEALEAIRRDSLERQLADETLNAEQRRELQMELDQAFIDEHKATVDKIKEITDSAVSMIDSAMEEIFEDGTKGLKNFGKEILKTILSTIEKQILAEKAAILASELATKSWAGVASAAGMMALIATAFAAAKAAIGSWSEGGFTGKGGKREVAGIVHKGEYVLPQEAVNNPALAPLIEQVEDARTSGRIGSFIPRLSVSGRVMPNVPPTQHALSVRGALSSGGGGRDGNSVLMEVAAAVRDLRERLDKPIEAQTHLLGKGGVNEAQDKLTRMMDNAKRN